MSSVVGSRFGLVSCAATGGARAARSSRLRLAAVALLASAMLLVVLTVVAAVGPARVEASVDYPFLEYDHEKEMRVNGFAGDNGVSSGRLRRARVTYTSAGGSGGALKLDYDVNALGAFEFYFESLWGERAELARNYLDRDDFFRELAADPVRLDRLDFWVRGSGATSNIHKVKFELTDEAARRVYRYVEVPDAVTAWTKVQLPLDLTGWSGASSTIDPRRLDVLAFVLEQRENTHGSGSFFLDEVAFVDDDANAFAAPERCDPVLVCDELLELIGLRAFQYFLDWYDPVTGLWQDRSEFSNVFSAAATGFGLSALAVGDGRGWIDHDLAVARVKNTLRKLLDGQQAGSTPAESKTQNGYRGFYYHFLDAAGRRDGTSELSSVDTALLLMGVLHVREHFAADTEIVELADALYERVQWPWMLSAARPGLFHQAWSPDCGDRYTVPAPGGGCFTPGVWDYATDEVMLIDLLAIGSPTYGVSADVFYAWTRERGSYDGYEFVKTWFGSLFTYFFAHEWIDFGRLGLDDHPDPAKRVDWHQNSTAAARANRRFVIDHLDDVKDDSRRYPAYGPDSWGLTAAEAPGPRQHSACSNTDPAYCNYGAPPVGNPDGPFHDGTIAPYGAAGVAMLVPDISIPALRHYYDQDKTDLWRERFGLADAYSLDPKRGCDCSDDSAPWYNRVLFGIDQGPMLLGIDNHLGGTTRGELMRNSSMRVALCTVFAAPGYCRPDVRPPQIAIWTPAHGAVYPRGAVVAADYECSEEPGGSGLAACSGPVSDGERIDTATLGAKSFTVTARDNAGNQSSLTHRYTVIDDAPPQATIRTPPDGAVYPRGAVVVADYECSDDSGGSGLAACSGPVPGGERIDTATLGAKSFTVTARDNAGNQSSLTHRYTVAPVCDGMLATIVVRPGSGPVSGTADADVIVGSAASDIIHGRGGADRICGGDGNDQLNGNNGNDRLFGADGDDELSGAGGNDALFGGAGDDHELGGGGNDVLHGGSGHDRLRGGNSDDELSGGDNADRVNGGDGNDTLRGGDGSDRVRGERGSDALSGGRGNDRLFGGAGDDELDGGPGRDHCRGGPGRDRETNCEA